ncbi:NEW3 domain-containing protein [Actinomadura rupiterrae]|uniref:NEW3 domain-containing protein n=1 Tax=Actinomadura rupiterrae TaxID=559627 RepID=UPI0020A4154A|nr:NEW3 domain-containing protein [Actinomadura rupiterrae]MCP2342360.1 hypothetical protein [Actinomadura rupiterrae]
MNTHRFAALALTALTFGALAPAAANAEPAAAPRPALLQSAHIAGAPRSVYPADLGLAGHADHRRPIPGEVQHLRWTVRNYGSRPVSGIELDARVPAGWKVRDDAGCTSPAAGRLHCTLGPLAPGQEESVRFDLTVPRHPAFGTERYAAATRFTVDGARYDGPSARMRAQVVPHRFARRH